MRKFVAALLLLGTVGVFSPFAAHAGGPGPDVSSGQLYTAYENEAVAYDPYGEGFYLSLSLYPKDSMNQPNIWNAIVCKSGPVEGGRIGSVPFKHDLVWRLVREKANVTKNFLANAGDYCAVQEVDLSFIPCNSVSYVRATVSSPANCGDPAGCDSDTGVIRISRNCGDMASGG